MRARVLLVALVCVALAFSVQAHEEDNELAETVQALVDRIAVLEKKLEMLEKNVHAGHHHDHDHSDHSHGKEKDEDEEEEAKTDFDESDVLVLDASNFEEKLALHDITLVEFYAPWCGHCKQLAPHYARAATRLKGGKNGALAKVDCTTDSNRPLCDSNGVNGFPTVKLFRKGSPNATDYSGERNADAIYKFMVRQSAPAVTTLTTVDSVTNFGEGESIKIVAFVDEQSLTTFTAVADSMRNDYPFGAVRNMPDVAAHFKVNSPAVVMFRSFDEPAIYAGDIDDQEAVSNFIIAESFPAIGSIGPDNYMKYVDRGLDFVWIFYDPSDTAQENLITGTLVSVAAQHKSKLSFVKLDGKMWSEHAKNFGLSDKLPGIALEEQKGNRRFLFNQNEELNAETFGKFIQGYLDKTLTPHFKSEPEPEDNSEPVKVVVGSTFEKIVLDDSKDVLVEFYAPWCGHCKQLAPKFDDLGKLFVDDKSVVIAKIDATANDTPEKIEGFPTIKFYPAGDKKNPVDYRGDRTAEAMAEFIQSNRKSASHDEL